jgi:hypothetical protein
MMSWADFMKLVSLVSTCLGLRQKIELLFIKKNLKNFLEKASFSSFFQNIVSLTFLEQKSQR